MMTSLKETLARLAQKTGKARVVAGGSDLMIQMREKNGENLILLDISQIDEIRGIAEEENYLLIGAASTMAEIASSILVKTKAQALARGASSVGSPQIRNVATIGGNVVNAQPAADAAVPLVALEAEARIVSPEGEKYVPVEDLYRDVGKSILNPARELISHFRVPVWNSPLRTSGMERLAKRKAFTLPTLSVAVALELDEKGKGFKKVRIVAAPVAPVPWRARRAEEVLKNAVLTEKMIEKAAAIAREDANPRESLRGGSAYRKDMVEVLTRRALMDSLSRLKEEVTP